MRDRLLDLPCEDIVTAIRAGDRSMYAMLFRAYWIPLVRWAFYYLNSQPDAEEVTANVFARVWTARTSWQVQQSVEAYLFGAVRSEVLRFRRDTGRRHAMLDRVEMLQDATPSSPDDGADATELPKLRHAAEKIPERYRVAIALRYEREMEYEEIAQVLGISNGAARVLVTRAVAALRTAV